MRVAMFGLTLLVSAAAIGGEPDLILHNGKIVTVDKDFSIRQALAVKGERIVAVGSDDEVRKLAGPKTAVVDLHGKMVLPGLIDSHVHANGAAMTDFDHTLPDFQTIGDVLNYIRERAKVVPEGQWITLRQVFITRLKEQRYPTKAELDEAAPKHPVLYSTGPDASINSMALKLSKIDKDFKVADGGAGYVEKDPKSGEPTGILRNCTRYVKVSGSSGRQATEADRLARLRDLFRDYNSVGLTGVVDRNAGGGDLDRYKRLLDGGQLTVRVRASHGVDVGGAVDQVQKNIAKVAEHPLTKDNPMLRIIGVKTFLDGGMLTGSAYMREPWGVSKIYSIDDPNYRGLLFISKEKLQTAVQACVDRKLQFTAHTVGDGAVHTLLNVYEEVNRKTPIRDTRPCITHSNFMSKEAVERQAKLGVVVDIQPAWLWLDTHTLVAQFGYDRLRYFQPLKSIFKAGGIAGGGSDHMQKIDSMRSVNPYNPFLGMYVAITRKSKHHPQPLHLDEALTREQAILFYTINNAYLMFLENDIGSLEKGKYADMIVLDRDLLTCDIEQIRSAQVLATYLGGKRVFEGKP
jgi:predicted amidohydrolase YtcJ